MCEELSLIKASIAHMKTKPHRLQASVWERDWWTRLRDKFGLLSVFMWTHELVTDSPIFKLKQKQKQKQIKKLNKPCLVLAPKSQTALTVKAFAYKTEAWPPASGSYLWDEFSSVTG